MKKLKLIVPILIILIFCIGIVSASDDVNSTGTFEDIQTKVDAASDKGTVELDDSYSGDKEVSISKSVTIQGSSKGTTINGKNITRAFNVKSGDVTFKNLNFVDCIANNGGAVYSTAKSLTFINCNFINNHASVGGAIYAKSDLTIKDSRFEENSAGTNGGAIGFDSVLTKTKSATGNINIQNSKFIKNVGGNGAAISFIHNGNVKSTTQGIVTVDKCVFDQNTGGDFGTIFFVGSEGFGKLIVKNSVFNKNSANEGSAIDTSNGELSISNTNFTNNKAEYAAVEIDGVNKGSIKNCIFKSNTADAVSGLKLYDSTVTMTDCKFQSNSLGAINLNADSKLNVVNSDKKTTFSKLTVLDNSFKKIIPIKISASDFVSSYNSYEKFKITLNNIYTKQPAQYFRLSIVCKSAKKTKSYYVTTKKDGSATVKLTRYLHAGNYKVTFVSEDWSTVSGPSMKLTVKKAKTIVKAAKVTAKHKKSKYFKATIKHKVTKKPLDYVKIKVKVYTGKKAKTYTLKTNGNGVLKLNTKKLSKGLHKVIIKSTKDYKINKKSSIKIK